MMCSKFLAGAIVLGILSLRIAFSSPITGGGGDGDLSRECVKHNFESMFNITVDNKIVIIYNSALCKLCMPKLLAFKALQLRFEIAEFSDTLFILLTTEHSGTQQFAELQSKAGDILVISLHDMDNDFFVAGSIYVFDKCSRLTYELFPPWSEVQYQWVKAAILSTLYDTPCGRCEEADLEDLAEFLPMPMEEDIATTTDSDDSSDGNSTESLPQEEVDDTDDIYHLDVQANDTAYKVNLSVILPLAHVHYIENNTYVKYNYITFESDTNSSSFSPEDHGHLASDRTEILYDEQAPNVIDSTKSGPPEFLRGEDGKRFAVTLTKVPSGDMTTPNNFHGYLEVKQVSEIVVVRPTISLPNYQNLTNSIHASLVGKLRKWLSYRLLSPFFRV